MKENNFHYIEVLLDMMYGIELDPEEVEEIGLIGWQYIGNKNTRLYEYSTNLDSENSITLPCNLSSIEAVTVPYEDWSRVTNYSENGDINTTYIEQYIEAGKVYNSPYYTSGKLVPYELVGNTLYFSDKYRKVNVLYKGILMDDEGLPAISDKEATALATYIAYYIKLKEGLVTNNPQITQQAEYLYSKWLKQCDQARVTQLSQNDMNQILEIKTSWDRKSYGIGYKIMK